MEGKLKNFLRSKSSTRNGASPSPRTERTSGRTPPRAERHSDHIPRYNEEKVDTKPPREHISQATSAQQRGRSMSAAAYHQGPQPGSDRVGRGSGVPTQGTNKEPYLTPGDNGQPQQTIRLLPMADEAPGTTLGRNDKLGSQNNSLGNGSLRDTPIGRSSIGKASPAKAFTGQTNEQPRDSSEAGSHNPHRSSRRPRTPRDETRLTNPRAATMDGREDDRTVEELKEHINQHTSLEGIIDLTNTEDVDYHTQWAPAVTHEVVKPVKHEIVQERVYREIHNYDVYHRIQPVYKTVILPAKHFIPNPDGEGLIEVSEDQLPECTGPNQRWFIGERELPKSGIPSSQVGLTSPKIIEGKAYMAAEGFNRKDTTILHPSTLEDLSGYNGAVLPILFSAPEPGNGLTRTDEALDRVPDAQPMRLKELTDALPEVDGTIPGKGVPPRHSSLRHSMNDSSAQEERAYPGAFPL